VTVGILDYGYGNVGSLGSALKFVTGVRPEVINCNPKGITHLVVPGVGHYGGALHSLRVTKVEQTISLCVGQSIPVLGICLGMQILCSGSEEAPGVQGLRLFDGNFVSPSRNDFRIPHVGFNQVDFSKQDSPFSVLGGNLDFYFNHSYFLLKSQQQVVLGETNYGGNFVSMIGKRGVYGCQFHPELSHDPGLEFLKVFLGL
jgi:imidazole glycerol-phosphate synthase subunit HisH